MPKITLTDVATLDGIIGAINSNNEILEDAIENTLSRDGLVPNAMGNDFDMNGNQILNLPEAVDPTDPVRLVDLEDTVGDIVDDYIAANPDLEGPPGQDGTDGVSFIFRGAYSGATAYFTNDVVTNQSSSWIALQNTTGNAPPTLPTSSNAYWQALAVKGTDGAGTGDVSSTSNFGNDNRLIRSDGVSKNVQPSGITIDDSDNVSGAAGSNGVVIAKHIRADYGGNDDYTKVLLQMEGTNGSTTFTDTNFGGSAKTWTANGNAQLTTTGPLYGTSSGVFDGSGDYITCPDTADFDFGSGEFTVDFYLNPDTAGNGVSGYICGQADSTPSTTSVPFGIYKTSANVIAGFSRVGSTQYDNTGTTSFATAGWRHVAYVRSGNTLMLFINGVKEGGDVAISGSLNNPTTAFTIGRLGDYNASYLFGKLKGFRITKGLARWTGNFTPPPMAYS